MLQENKPALETNPTIVMKDHTFDRDLDDLGMSPEDLEREIEPDASAAPGPQEPVLRH